MRGSHFTVFGGSFVHEARSFNPANVPRRETLAVWGFVLATVMTGVTTLAAVTAAAWAG
jgi:hypothetical protein